MSEPSSVNFSVSVPGKEKSSPIGRMLTLERIIEWINSDPQTDEQTKKNLIAQASRYPSHALPMFKQKYQLMLQRARAKRAEESGLEPQQSTISQEEKSGSTEQKFSSFEDGLNQTWSENASEKENDEETASKEAENQIDDWQDEETPTEESTKRSDEDQTDSDTL
tara:strand:+ start:309 stop:806 length:498 start_codon:yes stop_codon:yes gene_type:complete